MKRHKSKILSFDGWLLRVQLNGVNHAFLVTRPTPLSSTDAQLIRAVADTSWIATLTASTTPRIRPNNVLMSVFQGLRSGKTKAVVGAALNYAVCGRAADYLESVGAVEGDFITLTKKSIEDVRSGKFLS